MKGSSEPNLQMPDKSMEKPNSWWAFVYILILILTLLVILGLAAFSAYFSV